MMTGEKMAKVVSGINGGLASSGPQGVEGFSPPCTNSNLTHVRAGVHRPTHANVGTFS